MTSSPSQIYNTNTDMSPTHTLHFPLTYRCPLCHAPLHQEGNSLKCEERHTFDYAKEGYVHLLPVQQKHSRAPGDDKHMVQARRHFLEAGYYDCLKEHLQQLISGIQPRRLLDIGCGEGFFTQSMAQASTDEMEIEGVSIESWLMDTYGLDISKNAIRAAARKHKDVAFCIASYKQLPFQDHSLDVITRIYAPSDDDELHRVLNDSGRLIIVTPGPDHLLSLRQRIYDEVRPHQEQQKIPTGFQLKDTQRIRQTLELNASNMLNLLEMTPFGWHASEAVKTSFVEENMHSVEVDFIVSVYQRVRH